MPLLSLGILLFMVALGRVTSAAEPPLATPGLKTIDAGDYLIVTDLNPDQTREVQIRMRLMLIEYQRQTHLQADITRQKLSLYLFRRSEDYFALGFPTTSAGVFTGKALFAISPPGDWHVLQHEGFHQFSQAAAGGRLPPWVEEGLGEYFGESLFAGDRYISGLIPSWRLKRLKEEIRSNQLTGLREFGRLSNAQWNRNLSFVRYDQAWSLVHYLLHDLDRQNHRCEFVRFLRLLAAGNSQETAWKACLPQASDLERAWRNNWLSLDDDPSHDAYALVAISTLINFLARATAAGQHFDSFPAFDEAAAGEKLRTHPDDWLPPALAVTAVTLSHQLAIDCRLETPERQRPRLIARLPDGTSLVGSFTLDGDRVRKITIDQLERPGAAAVPSTAVSP